MQLCRQMESAVRRGFFQNEIGIQKVLPVCDFGRADNIYFQGRWSLSSKTLSKEEIISKLSDFSEDICIPSHIFDHVDCDEILSAIAQKPQLSCRLLVAWGDELESLRSKIESLCPRQWKLDIVIERPHEEFGLEGLQKFSRRWLFFPHRFFDLKQTFHAVSASLSEEELKVVFLEPANKEQFLFGPDEVILWQHWLNADESLKDKVRYLVLQSIDEPGDLFYQSHSHEIYRENFVSYGQLKAVRKILVSGIPDKKAGFLILSFLLHKFIFLFTEPKAALVKIYWPIHVFFRWRLPATARAVRREAFVFFRWRIPHLIKMGLNALRWQLFNHVLIFFRWRVTAAGRKVFSFFRWGVVGRIQKAFVFVRWNIFERFWQFMRWQIPAYSRKIWVTFWHNIIPVAFYPLFKIYWILEYQLKKRWSRQRDS